LNTKSKYKLLNFIWHSSQKTYNIHRIFHSKWKITTLLNKLHSELTFFVLNLLLTKKAEVWMVRQKKKICMVPVTRPYLFFSPDPELFFICIRKHLVRFFTQYSRKYLWTFLNVHVNILKIKQNSIILTSVLKLICCLDGGK